MRVQIHSQAEPPFVHELGFGVAPGFQTFVATQEQRVSDENSSSTSIVSSIFQHTISQNKLLVLAVMYS